MSSRRNSITSNISISTQNSSNLIRSTSVDQLMGLDEKFSKRVMKKTPTQMTNSKPSSVNAVNSVGSNSGSPPKSGGGAGGFHKQLGIYYFPNGEVFRPRNAKKKSDDNSPVVCSSPAALSVSASASSSSSFSGHNYQNNSKEELSADLPRSLSFSSIPAHHTFLTKSNSINNMKKINLVQSLRANTNDTPTNIQVASIDRPSPSSSKGNGVVYESTNLVRSTSVVSFDENNTSSSNNHNSDSNPSSLSNYNLNRSLSNTPTTLINNSIDESTNTTGTSIPVMASKIEKIDEYPPRSNSDTFDSDGATPPISTASITTLPIILDSSSGATTPITPTAPLNISRVEANDSISTDTSPLKLDHTPSKVASSNSLISTTSPLKIGKRNIQLTKNISPSSSLQLGDPASPLKSRTDEDIADAAEEMNDHDHDNDNDNDNDNDPNLSHYPSDISLATPDVNRAAEPTAETAEIQAETVRAGHIISSNDETGEFITSVTSVADSRDLPGVKTSPVASSYLTSDNIDMISRHSDVSDDDFQTPSNSPRRKSSSGSVSSIKSDLSPPRRIRDLNRNSIITKLLNDHQSEVPLRGDLVAAHSNEQPHDVEVDELEPKRTHQSNSSSISSMGDVNSKREVRSVTSESDTIILKSLQPTSILEGDNDIQPMAESSPIILSNDKGKGEDDDDDGDNVDMRGVLSTMLHKTVPSYDDDDEVDVEGFDGFPVDPLRNPERPVSVVTHVPTQAVETPVPSPNIDVFTIDSTPTGKSYIGTSPNQSINTGAFGPNDAFIQHDESKNKVLELVSTPPRDHPLPPTPNDKIEEKEEKSKEIYLNTTANNLKSIFPPLPITEEGSINLTISLPINSHGNSDQALFSEGQANCDTEEVQVPAQRVSVQAQQRVKKGKPPSLQLHAQPQLQSQLQSHRSGSNKPMPALPSHLTMSYESLERPGMAISTLPSRLSIPSSTNAASFVTANTSFTDPMSNRYSNLSLQDGLYVQSPSLYSTHSIGTFNGASEHASIRAMKSVPPTPQDNSSAINDDNDDLYIEEDEEEEELGAIREEHLIEDKTIVQDTESETEVNGENDEVKETVKPSKDVDGSSKISEPVNTSTTSTNSHTPLKDATLGAFVQPPLSTLLSPRNFSQAAPLSTITPPSRFKPTPPTPPTPATPPVRLGGNDSINLESPTIKSMISEVIPSPAAPVANPSAEYIGPIHAPSHHPKTSSSLKPGPPLTDMNIERNETEDDKENVNDFDVDVEEKTIATTTVENTSNANSDSGTASISSIPPTPPQKTDSYKIKLGQRVQQSIPVKPFIGAVHPPVKSMLGDSSIVSDFPPPSQSLRSSSGKSGTHKSPKIKIKEEVKPGPVKSKSSTSVTRLKRAQSQPDLKKSLSSSRISSAPAVVASEHKNVYEYDERKPGFKKFFKKIFHGIPMAASTNKDDHDIINSGESSVVSNNYGLGRKKSGSNHRIVSKENDEFPFNKSKYSTRDFTNNKELGDVLDPPLVKGDPFNEISMLPSIERDTDMFDEMLTSLDEKFNRNSMFGSSSVNGATLKALANTPFLKDDELTKDQIEDQQKMDDTKKNSVEELLPTPGTPVQTDVSENHLVVSASHNRNNLEEPYVDDNILFLQNEVLWIDQMKSSPNDGNISPDGNEVDDTDGYIDIVYNDENGRQISIRRHKTFKESSYYLFPDDETETINIDNEQLNNLFNNLTEQQRRQLPMHLKYIKQFKDYANLEITIKTGRKRVIKGQVPAKPSLRRFQYPPNVKRKSVAFGNKIYVNETYAPEMYKRYNKLVTQYTLTEPVEINKIKTELNQYKCNEMLVHEQSQNNTHFFY